MDATYPHEVGLLGAAIVSGRQCSQPGWLQADHSHVVKVFCDPAVAVTGLLLDSR